MSEGWLSYVWWLDDEGHPWVRHECRADGSTDEWRLPNPPWSMTDIGVPAPSLDCEKCGAHTILTAADRRLSPSTTEEGQ